MHDLNPYWSEKQYIHRSDSYLREEQQEEALAGDRPTRAFSASARWVNASDLRFVAICSPIEDRANIRLIYDKTNIRHPFSGSVDKAVLLADATLVVEILHRGLKGVLSVLSEVGSDRFRSRWP
jgi:hypothetical protein